eukprot:276717_1
MSALLVTIYLFNSLCETQTNRKHLQSHFHNIQWRATLPQTVDIAADTFTVTEVSAYKELKIIPTITGLKNPSSILNDNTDSTIAIDHTVTVTWDFNNTLTDVDYVRLVTNCGASKASLFCNHSKLILTNASITYTQQAILTNFVVNIDIHSFANVIDCEHNILIVDSYRKSQNMQMDCGFAC